MASLSSNIRQDGPVNFDPTPTSVYQRVLGSEFEKLSPELHEYFSLPPEGMVGRASGTFDVAGSRRGWMKPILHLLAWHRVVFPGFARDVPFRAINIPGPGDGLSALREIDMPGGIQLIEDTMHVIDGRIHDFLGRNRALEVRFNTRVFDGDLSMISDKLWLHVGGVRIPVPAIFGARVILTETWRDGKNNVTLTLSNPMLGDLFEYSGSFTYVYE